MILLVEEGKGFPLDWRVLALVAACLFFVIFMKKSQRNRQREKIQRAMEAQQEGGPARRPGIPEGQRDPEVARLYIELSEFAREMEGRMDTKIAYLRRLIADGEKVMADLNRAIVDAEALKKGEPRPSLTMPPPRAPSSVPALPKDPAPPAEPPPAVIDVTVGGMEGGEAGKTPQDDLRDRILSLAAEGKSKEAIAEASGIPKGEVELILSLHRTSQKSQKGQRKEGKQKKPSSQS